MSVWFAFGHRTHCCHWPKWEPCQQVPVRIHHLDTQLPYSVISALLSLAMATMQSRIRSSTLPSSFQTSSNTTSREKDLPDPYTTEGAFLNVCEERGVRSFLINKQSIFTDLVRKPFPSFVLFTFTCFYFDNNKLKRCHPCQHGIKIQSCKCKCNYNMQNENTQQ